MKRITLSFLAIILALNIATAQQSSEKPYIEVKGTVEKKFTPDVVLLSITISEDADGKGKESIDKLERDLIKAVEAAKLDKKSLTLNNFATLQKRINRRKDGDVSSRDYTLKVVELSKLNNLLHNISEVKGVNISASKFDFSNIEEIEDELYVEAMKKAKKRATLMTSAIGEKLDGVVSIHDGYISKEGSNNRPMLMKSRALNEMSADSSSGNIETPLSLSEYKFSLTLRVKFGLFP